MLPGTQRERRGFTLLEVMISLSILLVGLLGMMYLQIWGITSNQGARAHTQATQMARDLAAGLEKLSFGDARLEKTDEFGRLVQWNGSLPSSGYFDYEAAGPIPGVQPMVPPEFRRLWTVRDVASGAGGVATKVVAVSVVYHERRLGNLREVVLYVQQSDRSRIAQNVAAFQ